MYKAVLFDLDGTLTDTLRDIADAMNHALRLHGLPEFAVEEYKYLVGNGAKKLATTMLDADGNPMLKYFALDGAQADEYCMAFPKGSELVSVFNEGIQALKDSGKLDEMIQYWLY